MAFDRLLFLSILLAWPAVLYFLGAYFVARLRENSPSRGEAAAALAAAALALLASLALPPRSGYDNEHDLGFLAAALFPTDLAMVFSFKEISPLITNWAANLLSGYSLEALLWKNRLLQAAAAVTLFFGLRRVGAGLAAALCATAFLAFNYLSLLNASSYSSAPGNLFLWLVSLLALAEAYAAGTLGVRHVLWIGSSLVLVAAARYEFLPANFMLLAAVLACRELAGRRDWRSGPNLAAAAAFALLLGAWAYRLKDVAPEGLSQIGAFAPLQNFLYQAGERGFAAAGEYGGRLAAVFAGLSAGFALAGALLDARRRRDALILLAALLAWAVYFSAIYRPLDEYPLQFMRHQLYFLLPFAFIFAAGLAGLERSLAALRVSRIPLFILCAAGTAVYAASNMRAALDLKSELRTNDLEMAFLASAGKAWPENWKLVLYNCGDPVAAVMKGYFPVFDPAAPRAGDRLVFYRSARSLTFSAAAPREDGSAGYCGVPYGKVDYPPLLKSSFEHRFYTSWPEVENRGGRSLEIGFYGGKDQAASLALNTAAGALLRSGRHEEAQELLSKIVKDDPHCGLCRCNLASALLLGGRTEEARAELLATARFFPGVAGERHMEAFLLAAGGRGKEAAALLAAAEKDAPGPATAELAWNLRRGLEIMLR